jgi:ribosome production factor 2
MVELGIENFKSMSEFPGEKAAVGNKPCFVFQGEEFGDEKNREAQTIKNLFLGEKNSFFFVVCCLFCCSLT